MTITGLWPYYKKHVQYGQVRSSEFRGKKLAADAADSYYAHRSVCKKEHLRRINPFSVEVDDTVIDTTWLNRSLLAMIDHLSQGYVPVLVFDGKKSPLKTAKAGVERGAVASKAVAELASLRLQYKDTHHLVVPAPDQKKARELLEKIDRVPQASKERYMSFFKELGLPWVQSTGEAERTCALLNRDGVCAAVLSSDGDSLACGANLVLRERMEVSVDGHMVPGFSTAELEPLLDSLKIDFPLFQELCIMSGTDFNKNMKGIGFGKALPLLREYKSIRKIGEHGKYDISVLNHKEVKKEFAVVPWEQTASAWQLDLLNDPTSDLEVLKRYGYESLSTKLGYAKKRALAALASCEQK